MAETDTSPRPIGGFFALGIRDVPARSDSIWQSWIGEGRSTLTAWTARAAVARLIAATHPGRVWLPAYTCRELATAAPSSVIRFYPLDLDQFSPKVRFLGQRICPGDMVIAINYFGWPPCQDFTDFAAGRPDVIWVEDRAHCLWTDALPWAPWVLYSPRKLIGVGDGGILVGPAETETVEIGGRADASQALPELTRLEDVEETETAIWYREFKGREARLSAVPSPMSQLSIGLLQRTPIATLVEARQRNYAYLMRELSPYAAWQRDASGVAPFGFVIKAHDAAAIASALADERIFCPRHWAPEDLPSDPAEFKQEHKLAGRLLTLPCDHRYDPDALARLVTAVQRLMPLPSPGN